MIAEEQCLASRTKTHTQLKTLDEEFQQRFENLDSCISALAVVIAVTTGPIGLAVLAPVIAIDIGLVVSTRPQICLH